MQRKLELQQFIALFFVICPLSPSQEPIYFPLPLNLELVQITNFFMHILPILLFLIKLHLSLGFIIRVLMDLYVLAR